LTNEASHPKSVESDSKIETVSERDASENSETVGDSEFSGEGENLPLTEEGARRSSPAAGAGRSPGCQTWWLK
jgi:hypothetical protein